MALALSGDLELASPQFRAGLVHLLNSHPALADHISMFDLDPESSLVPRVHYQSAEARFKSQIDPCPDLWCPDRTSEVQTTLLGPWQNARFGLVNWRDTSEVLSGHPESPSMSRDFGEIH
jgi:hypothetical protein